MGLASAWTSVVLAAILICWQPAKCETNADKIAELLDLQEQAVDSVIRLDDNSLKRFALQSEGRPYSLVIFFDAVQMRDRPELKLEELRREFGLVAAAFAKNNKDTESASKIFFVDLELGRSQASFHRFGVKSLPMIRHLPPGKVALEDSQPLSTAGLSLGAAEGIAAFVEEKTRHKVGPIERPPFVSRQQMVVMGAGLALAAPFVIKMLMAGNTPFHEKELWCSAALLVYFFSVSGGMFNIIRGTPLFMRDRNDPNKLIFFYQQSGQQLGTEGFVVGFLYTIVGVTLAIISHYLVRIHSTIVQRVAMVLGMAISFWAVRSVLFFDNWKTGYWIHAYWPTKWR